MECSWKTVLLLVCASLGVQYTAIRTLRDSLSGPCQGAYRCQTRHLRDSRWRALCDDSWIPVALPRKHILLFATTRSGSSFTGQLLNQHPGFSTCSSRSTTSSRPSLIQAAGCVAPWTAGPCWERTGTSSSISTPATFTSWRITSAPSPRTTSQTSSSAEAPATPSVPLLCAWKQEMRGPRSRLMKPGVPRSVGP
ncbi:unnamed protein product [Pleuronectes platessa]|uniref:Sulfotransferase n=1 Tax=Pleuronectes platessa TaxID=8262 RepID=A0A9N7Z039_PLEPL|nr:unnamed protein product [Pleuronectes platessa]